MAINEVRIVSGIRTPDDTPLFVIRKDFSGGVNTRQHSSVIAENQGEVLKNVDLGVLGESTKRPGSVLIGNDVGDVSPACLHNYEIQGATDQLLMYENTTLWKWTGSGNWTSLKANFTAATDVGMVTIKESGLAPDDVVIIQNDTDNAFRVDSGGNFQDLGSTAGTGSDSPPKSTVMAWYGNRLWVLNNDQLYYSDAYAADYSNCFDTVSNWFRVPVGEERKIIPTRDTGMVIMGKEQIWGLNPTTTPAATDKPEPLITNMGVVSKKGAVAYGDNIYFFAPDGFRELKRTIQDKLQIGITYPISYRLKTEYERISWANIEKLSMAVFDNKIFIAVPTSATTFDTWVYFPAIDAFMVIDGWSPTCWSTYKVDGEERLYYGLVSQGKVYRAWYGYTDQGTTTTDGTAVTMTIDGREENLGQPLITKVGGELEIEAEVAGSDNTLTVNVAVDGGSFVNLGTVSLDSDTAPTLPINLPFSLSDSYVVREKFHLEPIGRFRTIQVEITNSDSNTSPIKVYGYNIISFQEAFENE
jgi:hypothetical protein